MGDNSLFKSILNSKPKQNDLLQKRKEWLDKKQDEDLDTDKKQKSQRSNHPSSLTTTKASPLAPTSFYPSSSSRLARLEDRVLRFLTSIQRRVRGEDAHTDHQTAVWREFPTQQAAFDLVDDDMNTNSPLSVFARELSADGKRRFLVTTTQEFWKRYKDMSPPHRLYYEIIREGCPCHMYFDLEYTILDNPNKDGDAAVASLVHLLQHLLQQTYAITINPDESILELDSSTDIKFSRHLIVRLPGAAFTDTSHLGGFIVTELCNKILKLATASSEGEDSDNYINNNNNNNYHHHACNIMINKDSRSNNKNTLMIDTGVYTRNRAFRLYLSSKAEKMVYLKATKRWMGGQGDCSSQKDVFYNSLVCHGIDKGDRLLRSSSVNNGGGGGASRHTTTTTTTTTTGTNHNQPQNQISRPQYGPSPFPSLETFITTVSNQNILLEGGTARGKIQSWVLMEDCGLVLYTMSTGNRWCGNIGRQHKSNRVFYVVDLVDGWWCQRCYDPDCRGYRSPLTVLPSELQGLWNHNGGGGGNEGEDNDEWWRE
jgi:DNA-directed primase/polymerase protein